MPAKSRPNSIRRSGHRKYGEAAGKSVASAVRREKRGTLRSGKGGKGGSREDPKTGNRNRLIGGPQESC